MSKTETQLETQSRPTWTRAWPEWIATASLVLLVGCYLHLSWRRWPDLQVDFGRELYVPWRLSEGDVLGRDVAATFGPLSQYFNAGLFTLFGPGLMVLVGANLAVYSAILLTAYRLLRHGWGVLGAWAGCAGFVAVFSFSQYIGAGNCNYATPYAHEATHGLLVCLLLTAALLRHLQDPGWGRAALAGGLLGLTALLKIEFMVAALVVVTAAVVLRRRNPAAVVTWREAASFAVAALLPTLLFSSFLARDLPWTQALRVTGKGWLTAFIDGRYSSELDQKSFLGTDQPLQNLQQGAFATIIGLALFGGVLAGAAWIGALRRTPGRSRWLAWPAAGALGLLAYAAGSSLPWIHAGRGLLGLTVLAWLLSVRQHGRDATPRPETTVRILVGALAIALLFRMLLNVRLYHYGFVQAALAAMVLSATLVSDWPRRFIVDPFARTTAGLGMLVLLATAGIQLTSVSATFLRAKTYRIGSGTDFFYEYARQDYQDAGAGLAGGEAGRWARLKDRALSRRRADSREARLFEEFVALQSAKGIWLNDTLRYLARTAPEETVLVLPEGIMINYLARRRSPLAVTKYFGQELSAGRESQVVRDLQARKPGHAVIFGRDLRDNGIARYGTKVGAGQLLLQWIADNYTLVAQAGVDPLDSERQGIALYKAKSASTP